MLFSRREKKLTRELIALAREKGYGEDFIKTLLMMSCLPSVTDRFGSSEEATKRLLEFVKESETQQDCFDKVLDLAGMK